MQLELGATPALFASLAHAPQALQALWSLLESCLLRGRIPRTTKELIALAATATARVGPWRDLFWGVLCERGVDARVLEDLVQDGRSERLPERTQQVLFLGRRAALRPALLTDADFARARRQGLDEAELAELVALAGAISLIITSSRALNWVE